MAKEATQKDEVIITKANSFSPPTAAQSESRPSRYSTVPFQRNPDFIYRDILAKIRQKCSKPASRAVLLGLGGVGYMINLTDPHKAQANCLQRKSELAIEYSYRAREESSDTWVFWVYASSHARVEEGYRKIADRVKLTGSDEPRADIFRIVNNWLCDEANGQWIMIVDNADDPDLVFNPSEGRLTTKVSSSVQAVPYLSNFLPQSRNGSVLITSRNRAVALRLTGSYEDIIEVNPMDEDGASALLHSKLQGDHGKDDMAELVQTLDYMPLAISQAAAYINSRAPRITVSKYLNDIHNSGRNRISLLKNNVGDSRRDISASNSIITTWQISFEYIRGQRRSAAELLSLMSLFDRQGIPDFLLHNNDDGEIGTDIDFIEDLFTLRSYSLIGTYGEGNMFGMHSSVQLSTRKWLELAHELETWKEKCITIMDNAFPTGDYKSWIRCQALFPHAEAVLAYRPTNIQYLVQWTAILNKAAWYVAEKGSYPVAEEMDRRALEERNKALGLEHPDTLISVSNLAFVLQKQGKYEEAEKMNRRALEGMNKALGPEHPDTLISVSNLALMLRHQGKYNEAEKMNRHVVDVRKKMLGPEHPDTLISVSNLALVLWNQGKYNEAEKMNRQALEGRNKALGPEHPDTLMSVSNLALMLRKQGKYNEAEKMNQQALKGMEKVLGLEHPVTLTSISNLASVFRDQGKYNEAEEMDQQALKRREKALWSEPGSDIVRMTGTLNDLDFSDSGYSSAPSLQSSDIYLVAEEIASFLLDNSFFRSLITLAIRRETRISIVAQRLRPLIKRYGQDLEELAGDSTHFVAARELIRHAPYIAEVILRLYNATDKSDRQTITERREARIEALLQDRVPTTSKLSLSESTLDERLSVTAVAEKEAKGYLYDEASEEQDSLGAHLHKPSVSPHTQLSKPALDEVKQFMAASNGALDSFLNLVCRLIYLDPLEAVKDEFLRGIKNQSGLCRVQFNLSWEIEEYLDQEIVRTKTGETDQCILGSLLVLSGDARHCFANSCQVYMKWKWPQTFKVLLDAMLLGSEGRSIKSPSVPGAVIFSYDTKLTPGVTLNAFGTKEFLVDVAQQVSWLTASVRLPRYGQVSYSDTLFLSTDVGIYKAIPLPLQPVEEKEDACWLPLFLGTVIARNYPIPERQQEKGLELPFDLMTTVAGNMLPMCHDGGVYLKGHSRLLFPVSSSIPGSIQWHLITSSSRRESLPPGIIHKHIWLRIPDPRVLSNAARTFLGYCRQVIVDLGTNKPTGYYGGIKFSNAHDEDQGPSIQAPTSFTWGSSGMGIFGATLSHSIAYGKALAQTVTRGDDDYLDILDLAMDTPIILYDDDNESDRGWMVPALSVILHMVHTWAAQMDYVESQLPCVETTWKAGDAARTILIQKWDFVLRNSSNEEMSKKKVIKDLVMQFWHGIRKRREEDLIARCQSTPAVELATSKLHGWDYMDLVRGRQSRRKQLKFNGNWRDLTEDVLVLFGQKLGEVIKPAPGISVCTQWNPIPPKKMYLTATIDCLQQLSWQRGGHRDNLVFSRLTNKSYWNYRADSLFTDCKECDRSTSSHPVKCSKTLQNLDSSAGQPNQSLVPPSEGAVVFGCQSQVLGESSHAETQRKFFRRLLASYSRHVDQHQPLSR
ncbi:MAG: hypothetical protein M1830_005006 [Pleopsidium flavum]|nr:MAG: hypothetical protein M1830_005006 [Pleopsidium flavum]